MYGYQEEIHFVERTDEYRDFRFGLTTVRVPNDGLLVVTGFPDGTTLEAAPQDDPEYLARARSLGYHDAAAMNREHDALHSFLAACVGLPFSPTLWAKAHEIDMPSKEIRDAEEALVLAFERCLNDGVYHHSMQVLHQVGMPYQDMVHRARELFR